VDAPLQQATGIDAEEAVRTALDKRTDLQQARKQLETIDSNLRFYHNQTLPQLNLEADYGTRGIGGTQLLRGEGFPGPIIGELDRSMGSVFGDVFSFNYPSWTVGLTMSYTLGKNASEATYARTQIERDQAALQIRRIELEVGTEVRNVVRQVNTNLKRVDATRAATALAERRLEAEQKKFGVGMSTSFLVFQAQRDLSTARVNQLSAILDYNKSLADYEAVQESSISGGTVTVRTGTTFQAVTTGTGSTSAAIRASANQQ
jgi:HAE1 family hydrophobic/amphiphilic exporter-1